MWFQIFEVQLNFWTHVWSSTHANLWQQWPTVLCGARFECRDIRWIQSFWWLERLLSPILSTMIKYLKLFIAVAIQLHLCCGFQVTGKRFISNSPSKISSADFHSLTSVLWRSIPPYWSFAIILIVYGSENVDRRAINATFNPRRTDMDAIRCTRICSRDRWV